MKKKTYHFAVCCSVCNSVLYGFGDTELDITNPGIRCARTECDGYSYVVYQTTKSKSAAARNWAIEKLLTR